MSQLLNSSLVSTPENRANLNNTPSRSNGANKNLFTPCRRLGLSRRYKSTSNGKSQDISTPSSSFTSTPVSLSQIRISGETPKNNKNEERVNSSPLVIENELDRQDHPRTKKSKSGVELIKNKTKSKKKLVEDADANDENEETYTSGNTKQEESNDNSDSDQSLFNEEVEVEKNKKEKPRVMKEIQNKGVKKSTTLGKRLSMKRSDSKDDQTDKEDLLSTPKSEASHLLKECAVDLEELAEFVEEKEEPVLKKRSTKKRCVIYSSDEDDFVPSQPKSETEQIVENKKDRLKKINEMKSRIKQKKENLAELKQAAIYKKLHNVEELKKLTNIWKMGCQDSLRYLLGKLREHAEIDMLTLMNNLKIPDKIIYDPETDNFK